MKRPMLLWKVLAEEFGQELCVDTTRDFDTVSRRCEDEGEKSFLTITLPHLGKHLDRCLADGAWNSRDLTEFGHSKGLPRFLGGFLELIFARDTGVLLPSPNTDAIRAVRQLSGLFGKVFEVCDDRKVFAAMEDWVKVDQEVGVYADSISDVYLKSFEDAALAIWSRPLSLINRKVDLYAIEPRHSSGGNADKRKGNSRWQFTEWTDRLESVFPFVDYAIPSHRYWEKSLSIRFLDPGSERACTVLAVPKTAEKPRIITLMPSYMQYMQQGLAREFMLCFEDSRYGYSDVIQLRDRTHNQKAACTSSVDGLFATLDLSEASDRLSNRLVMSMFNKFGSLGEAISACRTERADVGGLGEIKLNKFASMGSALTFPIQTMVFMTVVFMGIAQAKNISPGLAFSRYRKGVRVFGDDIVVPTDSVECVVDKLESFGLKINRQKSFWTGKFRESCGGDYYDGVDVTYVKARKWLPLTHTDAEGVESASSLRNRFYEFGLWKTASWLDSEMESLIRFYPTVTGSSQLIGRMSYLPPQGDRIHPKLQVPISKGYVPKRILPKSRLDGADALLKWFVEEHGDMPTSADDRFERAGRPQRATLKLRWGAV